MDGPCFGVVGELGDFGAEVGDGLGAGGRDVGHADLQCFSLFCMRKGKGYVFVMAYIGTATCKFPCDAGSDAAGCARHNGELAMKWESKFERRWIHNLCGELGCLMK